MENIKIKNAKQKDLPKIAKIFYEESGKKPYYQGKTLSSALEEIKKAFNRDNIEVLTEDKEVIGFIICELNNSKKQVWISELWFNKKSQGKGFGRKIIEYIEDKYKKEGFKTIGLLSNKKSNAVGFYQKLKFKQKAEYIEFTKRIK